MTDMDAYKDVFFAETIDFVQQLTDGLLELEREPLDKAPIEVVFRAAHSIKGMSAAMGYLRTADLTHAMEDLMSRVRNGELLVDHDLINLMLAAADLVRDLIDDEAAGTDRVDASETIEALAARTSVASGAAVSATATKIDRAAPELAEGERAYSVVVTLDPSCPLKGVRAYVALKRLNQLGRVLDTSPSAADIEDERFDFTFSATVATAVEPEAVRDALTSVAEIDRVDVAEVELARVDATSAAKRKAAPRSQTLPRLTETQTVRVSIGRLDALVDLVGEIVILRSRFDRLLQERAEDTALAEAVADMHRVTAELQHETLKTRMVSVGNIFNRFPRMVRDLAVDLGKEVTFEVTGLDIELDRAVLDEIGDSIVHLLRNAVDHGIEGAEQRVAAGKSAVGSVRLSAVRERDHVAITVSDDGGGIDPERIWAEACRRAMVKADQRVEYSDSDVLQLMCKPGFSTLSEATKVSGRGVGLDVVKEQLELLGGTMSIANASSGGTEFVLRLPLTLAIVKALLVEAAGQSFALPLSAVDEVFSAEELRVELVEGMMVVVLRDGAIVPLVRLDSLLAGVDAATPLRPDAKVAIMVAGEDRRALAVDRLLGRQEIVVKPLSKLLSDTRGFSGATILGDGQVLLILDPRTIFSHQEASR